MTRIAVVPRSILEAHHLLQHGFAARSGDVLAMLEQNAQWTERAPAEENPSLKQLIPYVVARRGEREVFATTRLSAGTEERLHGRVSVGIGGHIDRDDALSSSGVIAGGMRREWDEEVSGQPPETFVFLGLLNDDTNAVGQVHIGLVFEARLTPGAVLSVRETDKLVGEWMTIDALLAREEELESWSQHVLRALV